MRTYVELRNNHNEVIDWRVIIHEVDATLDAITWKAVDLLQFNHMKPGYRLSVFESELDAAALKLPRN